MLIEFADGAKWGYRFSQSADVPHGIDPLYYWACEQHIDEPSEFPGFRALSIMDAMLYKANLNTPWPRVKTHSNIHYLHPGSGSYQVDSAFIAELNNFREKLLGLAIKDKSPTGKKLFTSQSFHETPEGRIGLWLDDDHAMSNLLHSDWLPSGWKSCAHIISWLKQLPHNSICLIEEPENHLHPMLARALLEAIMNVTEEREHQLFLTTHSASLINIAAKHKLKIFQTSGTSIECRPDIGDTLDRMGYLASDLLQSNCIIWVEGPSDRLYLNHWITHQASDLVEGQHYSIMFYGGRLLSHLAGDDDGNLNDLIDLTRLNRHAAILIDSDKDSPGKHLNTTKRRLIKQFTAKSSRIAWVTKGREVENYLDEDALTACIKAVHRSAHRLTSKGQWANLLKYRKFKGRIDRTANKVKVADHYVKSYSPDFSILDLNQQVQKICTWIKDCNK